MPIAVDDVLRLKTFREKGVARRVFHTLQDNKALQAHRNSVAIAQLFAHLHQEGLLSDEETDKILRDCAM